MRLYDAAGDRLYAYRISDSDQSVILLRDIPVDPELIEAVLAESKADYQLAYEFLESVQEELGLTETPIEECLEILDNPRLMAEYRKLRGQTAVERLKYRFDMKEISLDLDFSAVAGFS